MPLVLGGDSRWDSSSQCWSPHLLRQEEQESGGSERTSHVQGRESSVSMRATLGGDEECKELTELTFTEEEECESPFTVERRRWQKNNELRAKLGPWEDRNAFKFKRLSVSLSSAVASLLVAALLATFVVTLRNVLQHRSVEVLRHKLEYLDKTVLTTNYRTFQQSTWIALEDLSNEAIEHVNERIPDSKSLDRAYQKFTRQFQKTRRKCDKVHRVGEEYRAYRQSCKAMMEDLESRKEENLLETLHSEEYAEEENYDRDYVAIRDELDDVQLDLHHDTRFCVFVGSVFIFVLAVLFVVIRLRALDSILMSEMTYAARNTLTHELGVPAFVIDEKSCILDINQAAISTLGIEKFEVLGDHIGNILSYDQEESTNALTNSQPTGRKALGVHRKTGRKSQFVAHTIRLLEVDGSERYTIVCHDTTTSYELEIQKKVLSQFCHEARNKYTPAAAHLEQILALTSKSPEGIKSELCSLHDDISMSLALLQEADMLISTRLNLYKLYSGNYDTRHNTQIVNAGELLRSRTNSAAAVASKAIEFRVLLPVGFDKKRELTIQIDTYVFQHIANNFLSNARKHTKTGHVTLRFIGSEDSMLHFAVVDTGFGIPPHIASRLFCEEVTTGSERGVGLGLVSCKMIAEAVNGKVWLHETKICTAEDPNGGTEFRFCLPGKIIHCPPNKNSDSFEEKPVPEEVVPAPEAEIRSYLPKCDVYVVEDSELIRRTIISKLKKIAKMSQCEWQFFEHSTVESILPSLSDFVSRSNVIVTVDENLDSQGGMAKGSLLIKTLKDRNFAGIVVSASGDVATARQHKELGADLAWGKPLPKNDAVMRDLCEVCAAKRT